ncbi:unnamed protein product, partial [Rangifer tarandus platyrhynchus]
VAVARLRGGRRRPRGGAAREDQTPPIDDPAPGPAYRRSARAARSSPAPLRHAHAQGGSRASRPLPGFGSGRGLSQADL